VPVALPNVAVRLWFDQSPSSGAAGGMFTGDVPMDNFFWLHRLYDEFREWHDATGGSAIEVHLYGRGALLDQPDSALLVMVTAELQRIFPALRGHFVHGALRRNGRTQTLFSVPTADSLPVETPWPGVYACGDWVAHPHPSLNMERSVVTAVEAANGVLRAHGLEPYPILAPRRPEALAWVLGGLVRAGRWVVGPVVMGAARGLRALHRRG
jgi:isorenieratene synthase